MIGMPDLFKEVLLTVPQICDQVPGHRDNDKLRPSTVTRWILNGVVGKDGTRVKLKAVRFGGRWLVREADLKAFLEALAGRSPDNSPPPAEKPGKPTKRRRQKVA